MATRSTTKGTHSDPATETHKSHRVSISHAQAVKDSEALGLSYLRLWKPKARPMVDLKVILRTLQAKKIPFVLVGAHAIGSYTGRPRATKDVDILTRSGRNHARAVKAIRELYPSLEVRPSDGVTAFYRHGEKYAAIDVESRLLEDAVEVKDRDLTYRVPTLEAALANKYAGMIARDRDIGDRALDAADFAGMVIHSNDPGQRLIDLERLDGFGEKIRPGGGNALIRLVEGINAGAVPNVNALFNCQ